MDYDPPSGWRYGFPRRYNPLPEETIEQTLIRDGYPARDAEFGARHCRFLGTNEEIGQLSNETGERMESREPRIILYDLETTHNLVAVFRLFDQSNTYINHENLMRERYIVSFAWKVYGEKKVSAVSVLDDLKRYKADPHDDEFVCRELHRVLSSADVIVAHNGDEYDIKFAEARMLYHGLSPLPPIHKIDTKKIAKSRFLFNSNRLDYLGAFLKVGRKIETEKGLWLKVAAAGQDAPKAIRTMVEYNKGDIVLLEKVFKKLIPYMPNFINRQLFGAPDGTCPRCGSTNIQSRGMRATITQLYRQFQCMECGGWFRNKKAEKHKINTRLLA